jgi:fibrillarin-like pre-rRNA processing protein
MKETEVPGVFKDRKQIFTQNPRNCKGVKVYNEKLVKQKDKEYRSWNPYRSKLAAGILNGLAISIKPDSNVLYLGAATGTTVSHISDIVNDGIVYAVENSPIAMKKLLNICEKRQNIIPVFANANHPNKYSSIVSNVALVYQDISQRNQSQIFIENTNRYLKKNGTGVLMVKARSIDVSLKPSQAYDLVCTEIDNSGLKIKHKINLSPYEKDHMAIVISA